jgi:hypothetical protein
VEAAVVVAMVAEKLSQMLLISIAGSLHRGNPLLINHSEGLTPDNSEI